VCRGTRVWKYGGFGAWLRTKFDGELDIKEKIKRIMGWRGVGSRIQVIAPLMAAGVDVLFEQNGARITDLSTW